MQKYFYQDRAGREIGPLSLDVLAKFRASGVLDGDTLVRAEGATAWQRCCDVIANPPVPSTMSSQPAATASGAAPHRNWLIAVVATLVGLAVLKYGFFGKPTIAGGEQAGQMVRNQESEGARQERRLAGSWQLSGQMASGIMTFSTDHTWVMSITSFLGGGSESGDWKLDGDQLANTTHTSTIDKSSIGKTEVFQIVKLDDTILIMKKIGGQGADLMMTFTRVKADVGKSNLRSDSASSSTIYAKQVEGTPTDPARKQKLDCLSNLKQIGLAFRIWDGNHGDKYPFNVSANAGGTLELCSRGSDGFDRNSAGHFRVMTKELKTPKILVCPADSSKHAADDFQTLQSANVSYQIHSGPDVDETQPQQILVQCPIHGTVIRCDGSYELVSKKP